MSIFLRSAQILKNLRNVSSVLHLAVRPQRAVCHIKPSPIVLARCLSIQPTYQRYSQVLENDLDPLLQKLEYDGQRSGRVSINIFTKIHELVSTQTGISPSQALLLLRCCGSLLAEELPAVRTEMADNLWKTLERQEVSLDLSHYNALLRVYLENEHDFSPLDFLSRLEAKGLEPNRITYQRLVARFSQLGDIEGASKILEFMKEKNIPINEAVFNSLILGHARANDLPSAMDMLDVMRSSGLEPSVDTYAVLACAQAEKGDLDAIKSTVAKAKESRQALHDRNLLEVVYTLTVSGHKQFVPEVLSMIEKAYGYNVDCTTFVYRLVNAGCDAEARLVYATMESLADHHSQSSLNKGLFFVKHLILRDRPVSTVVGLCDDLSGNSPTMLIRVLETAVLQNANLAYPIMDALISRGEELRPHYFWPLLAQCSAKGDVEGLTAVLRNMKTREVPITIMTLVDYVLPCMLQRGATGVEGRISAVHLLGDAGVHGRDAVNAVVKYDIIQQDVKSAAEIVKRFGVSLAVQLRRPLLTAICSTGEYEDAAILVGQMMVTRRKYPDAHEEFKDVDAVAAAVEVNEPLEETQDVRDEDILGRFLLELAIRMTSFSASVDLVAFLEAVKKRGLSISHQKEAAIRHRLGPLVTPEVSALLDNLASGILRRVELDRSDQRGVWAFESIDDLQATLKKHMAENKDPKRILIRLLLAYARKQDIEKTEETYKTLQDKQVSLGIGSNVTVLDMYCAVGQSQKALDILTFIYSSNATGNIMPSKCLKLARLLADEGKVDEAVEVMNLFGKRQASETAAFDSQQVSEEADLDNGQGETTNIRNIERICDALLKPFADKGDLETVQRLTDAIIVNKLCFPSRRLLKSMVAAHLVKEDIDGAMELLTRYWKDYKVLPNMLNMLRAFIKKEDTDKLRQLVDMSTEAFGESNSLLDLGIAFIEEGRLNEAKRIFSTPGLRLSKHRLNSFCQVLCSYEKFDCLEALLKATASVLGVDMKLLYEQALEAYINAGNCDRALGLWTQMQDEDVVITDKFLYSLGNFLRDNGRDVPFALPSRPLPLPTVDTAPSVPRAANVAAADVSKRSRFELQRETEGAYPLLKEYRAIMMTSPVDEVMAFHAKLNDMPNTPLSFNDTTVLIERLLDDERLADAIDTAKKGKSLRRRRITEFPPLRRMLRMLADAGDMDALLDLMASFPLSERGALGSFICNAAGKSNRVEECFAFYDNILDEVDTSTPEGLRSCHFIYPAVGMLRMLNENESLLSKVEDLAEKYKAKGVLPGHATLWAYHFCKGNKEKADQLKQELKATNTLLPHIAACVLMSDTKDLTLAPRLLQEFKDNSDMLPSSAVAMLHSYWIKVHCMLQQPKQGLEVLNSYLERGTLRDLKRRTIATLSEACAQENIAFPYAIPTRIRNTKPESISSGLY